MMFAYSNPFPRGSIAAALYGSPQEHWKWWWHQQRYKRRYGAEEELLKGEIGHIDGIRFIEAAK